MSIHCIENEILTNDMKYILSVTSDNASNNDKMIENLADRLDNFPGAANQTRCFLHILNLTAKSVIKQFEVPKKKLNEAGQDENDFGEAVDALQALSVEIEDDEPSYFDNDEEAKDDDDEGLEDERQGMTEEDMAMLEEELLPARRMMTKVLII